MEKCGASQPDKDCGYSSLGDWGEWREGILFTDHKLLVLVRDVTFDVTLGDEKQTNHWTSTHNFLFEFAFFFVCACPHHVDEIG